jgi:oligopeptide/dipeptide ABC transporter ATP-binding protein
VTDPLLHVEHLSKDFAHQRGIYAAPVPQGAHTVHDVSFDVNAGEIVALAGEAGSGKTTLARALALLMRPSSGKVIFEGRDLARQSEGALRPVRRRLQVLFSDPRTALNPQNLVSEVMLEPLKVQRIGTSEERLAAARTALRQVGLNSLLLERRLTALSAGERQRIALARVLTLKPALVICDDPARTLPPLAAEGLFKLMSDLRRKQGMAFLWLVSRIQAVANFADRIGVLYQGRLVEMGKTADVMSSPQHPYARQLLGGTPPRTSPTDTHHKGCPFQSYCQHVMPVCRERMPELRVTPTSQTAACFLYDERQKTKDA